MSLNRRHGHKFRENSAFPADTPSATGPESLAVTRYVVIAILVVAVFFGVAFLRGRSSLPVTGIYAEDWQTHCAPLKDTAQADCVARLDALYGRVAGAPVPPAGPTPR